MWRGSVSFYVAFEVQVRTELSICSSCYKEDLATNCVIIALPIRQMMALWRCGKETPSIWLHQTAAESNTAFLLGKISWVCIVLHKEKRSSQLTCASSLTISFGSLFKSAAKQWMPRVSYSFVWKMNHPGFMGKSRENIRGTSSADDWMTAA